MTSLSITPNNRPSSAGSAPTSKPSRRLRHVSLCDERSFEWGNPDVEIVRGILHLYKHKSVEVIEEDQAIETNAVCVIGVPHYLTIYDFVKFVMSAHSTMQRIQVLKEVTPSPTYLVLIIFHNKRNATDFYKAFNGRVYNTIENDPCQLAFVRNVETVNENPTTIDGTVEIPSCAICLERLDEAVEGIITVLCRHSLHVKCLTDGTLTTCPVCRFVASPNAASSATCHTCGHAEDTWMCLLCGFIGCGRYCNQHAFLHFQSTEHAYALNIGSDRVWDYVGDEYVHRLIENKTDGKIVAVSQLCSEDDKIDSIQMEYMYLLSSELHRQRSYFEDKLFEMENCCKQKISEMEERLKNSERSASHSSRLENEKKNLRNQLERCHVSLKEERALNENLRANQSLWEKQVNDLEAKLANRTKECNELQDMNRDLLFTIEGGKALSGLSASDKVAVSEGHISFSSSSLHNSRRSKKR